MGYQYHNNANDDETVERLRSFIGMLNEESEKGSVIVVEGKRDAEALSKVGFTGSPAVFHHFKGVADFLDSHDSASKKKKIILLLDMDRTGKYLTSRLVSQLQSRRQNVSLSYKRALAKITNGKVRHVEDLVIYAPRLSGITGSRKDLYFYT
ncbi:MAG: toprim domain-containing protein [Nitrososphaera sp.]|uniref:Putative glutamine amidotransferase class-I n=1 Tax=Nitrososphaera gargensis (strain Ga9.2) TaxID=1237085 RepID=K0IKE1_NITGG|nr:toprim domain-containing protein [Candidatus Nitrososphaera gargensis]AFU58862.1 putative glutamine amidotransferase class-I [Candidatus Nitrososphaera gargensis Ga9.2]